MSPLSDSQLIEFSGEHLLHELIMFWELTAILPDRSPGLETSALLESWVIHLRNLIDFFCQPGRSDDVTAWDFFDTPAAWTPTMSSVLEKARGRANKELSHLTLARKTGNPPDKAWPVNELFGEIETIAKDFAAKASDRKFHAKVREFLRLPRAQGRIWIHENVTHSNVIAPSTPLLDRDALSTATVIKRNR
jgi:hypothetical protein